MGAQKKSPEREKDPGDDGNDSVGDGDTFIYSFWASFGTCLSFRVPPCVLLCLEDSRLCRAEDCRQFRKAGPLGENDMKQHCFLGLRPEVLE